MDTNYDKKDDSSPYKQLSNTDDEENDETENQIDPSKPYKPSPSVAAQINTALPSPIDVVPIVATKAAIFPSSKVPTSLSSIYIPIKPPPVSTDYISPRFYIDGINFNKDMISEKSYLILADHCVFKDESCY